MSGAISRSLESKAVGLEYNPLDEFDGTLKLPALGESGEQAPSRPAKPSITTGISSKRHPKGGVESQSIKAVSYTHLTLPRILLV